MLLRGLVSTSSVVAVAGYGMQTATSTPFRVGFRSLVISGWAAAAGLEPSAPASTGSLATGYLASLVTDNSESFVVRLPIPILVSRGGKSFAPAMPLA